MNFQEYKAEDFLQEETFLNYCLARNADDVSYWTAWIKANPHKESDIRQAVEMYHVLNGGLSAGGYIDDQSDFVASLNNYKQAQLSPVKKMPVIKWWYAAVAAAVIVGIILINDNLHTSSNAIQQYAENSSAAQRKSLKLPDGSAVQLNSLSTLTVTEGFNGKSREVVLDGEAYFDVVHDPGKPFIIRTKSMNIKVLGTKLNVRAYKDDDESETALVEGSVEVTLIHDNNRKVVLVPNQKISYTGKTKASPDAVAKTGYRLGTMKKAAEKSKEISWTDNQLIFNDDEFDRIARTLERWYDVSIILEDSALIEYRFTGSFEDKPLADVLDALKLSRQFSYRIISDTVYLGK